MISVWKSKKSFKMIPMDKIIMVDDIGHNLNEELCVFMNGNQSMELHDPDDIKEFIEAYTLFTEVSELVSLGIESDDGKPVRKREATSE